LAVPRRDGRRRGARRRRYAGGHVHAGRRSLADVGERSARGQRCPRRRAGHTGRKREDPRGRAGAPTLTNPFPTQKRSSRAGSTLHVTGCNVSNHRPFFAVARSSQTPVEIMAEVDVIVIGAGVSGLTCARYLHDAGGSYRVGEASDGPGGRVRTDLVNGFLLDRGFQVFLTAYPEARRILDYDQLNLKPFVHGALV